MNEQRARSIVATRSGGRCEAAIANVCLGAAATMHHRLKRSHGGGWAPSNLLHLCGDGTTGCHGWIEAHPAWAHREGYWLMAGDDSPDQVSVHMRWENLRSWYVLDDEGILEWDLCDFEPITTATGAPTTFYTRVRA